MTADRCHTCWNLTAHCTCAWSTGHPPDTAETLLGELSLDDPWCRSTEGLDDCCMFCGSDHVHDGVHRHDHRCPWVRARRFLKRDLGDDHEEAPAPLDLWWKR